MNPSNTTPDLSKLDASLVSFTEGAETEHQLGKTLAEVATQMQEVDNRLMEAHTEALEESIAEMKEVGELLKAEQEAAKANDVREKLGLLDDMPKGEA
jgi:hypothetical protein